jgi:hypothetical protein
VHTADPTLAVNEPSEAIVLNLSLAKHLPAQQSELLSLPKPQMSNLKPHHIPFADCIPSVLVSLG